MTRMERGFPSIYQIYHGAIASAAKHPISTLQPLSNFHIKVFTSSQGLREAIPSDGDRGFHTHIHLRTAFLILTKWGLSQRHGNPIIERSSCPAKKNGHGAISPPEPPNQILLPSSVNKVSTPRVSCTRASHKCVSSKEAIGSGGGETELWKTVKRVK